MIKVNMRDYYPFYKTDVFVDVTEEIAEELARWDRAEKSQRRKKYRYHANYSLDWGDMIGNHAIFVSETPDEHYERSVARKQLHKALIGLSEKQRVRIYTHYVLGISQSEIARMEGVDHRAVNISIQRGLRNLKRYLKNIL